MVTTIVIPHDPAGAPRLQELANVGDFQEVTGGFLEPYEVTVLGITLWVNEAAHREHGALNARATALYWYYNANIELPHLILGDVVISGNDGHHGSTDIPELMVYGMLHPHRFVVQVSPHDNDTWNDTFARFDNVFEAAIWCMLLARTFEHGPAFRIQAETSTDALLPMQEEAPW